VKVPVLRTNPNIDETPTAPKPHTHPSHPETPRPSTPSSSLGFTSSSILPFLKYCLLLIDKVRAKDKTYKMFVEYLIHTPEDKKM
jgi:hypothetical protein